MAQDIVNASDGDATGNQKLGNIIIRTGSRGVNSYQVQDDAEHLIPVTGLDTQYEDRFDDTTYYG